MSKDTITVNMNVYDIPIVVEQLNKLEQENNQLKEVIEEVWDFIKKYPGISQSGVITIKQILDKAKGE